MSRSSLTRLARCSALCCVLSLSNLAGAAVLGDATVRSTLGQTLDADIAIVSLAAHEADSLMVRVAPPAAFADAGIDYLPLLRSLRVAVEKRGALYTVRLTSELTVSDPFVRFLLELNAGNSRIVREYTLLIDPPVLDAPATPADHPARTATAVPNDGVTAGVADGDGNAQQSTPAAARSALSPATPATHLVRRGDTLRSIGTAIQAHGVRLEQVLVALQNANPEAFIEHNIHRVRRGSVLRVPTTEAMQAIDPDQARRLLRTQTAAFVRHQRLLAQRAERQAPTMTDGAAPPAGNRSSSGQVGVRADIPATAAPGPDRLTLSTPGAGERDDGKASAVDAVDKVASEKALADANSRIAALEKNIGQLQQMLEIRNGEMADAQQRAAQSVNGLPPSGPAAAPAAVPAASRSAPPSAPAVPDPSSAAQVTAPAVRPPPRPTPAAPAWPAGSAQVAAPAGLLSMLADPLYRAAGVALLLLPLAWAVLRRRRRRPPSEGQAVEPVLVAQSVIAGAGGRHVDTRHSEFHSNFVPSVSQIDANEVDAVAEADVYIAYGRDEQAEEILLDALRAHPQRDALRVKLLEIYAARKDRQKFGALAAELRVHTHGAGADWEKAAQLGRQFDPGNRLFDIRVASAQPAAPDRPAAAFRPAGPPSPLEDLGLPPDGLPAQRHAADAAAAPALTMQEQLPSNGIDFSLVGIDAGPPAPVARGDAAALATKLELALACQEIGDPDGARELLSEVAGSGHAELAQRARSLLGQLA